MSQTSHVSHHTGIPLCAAAEVPSHDATDGGGLEGCMTIVYAPAAADELMVEVEKAASFVDIQVGGWKNGRVCIAVYR